VRVYWGPDFSHSDTLAQKPGLGFGGVAAAGDVDGDGFDEIFAQSPAGNGVIWEYRRRTLRVSASEISIGAGPTISFMLDLGLPHAGELYLAALSSTMPGEGLILGPGTYLPIEPDGMTSIGLSLLGTSVLENFTGTLDAQGQAVFKLHWPAGKGAGLLGKTLYASVITATSSGALAAGTNDVELALEP
jgi:hypothetical protein